MAKKILVACFSAKGMEINRPNENNIKKWLDEVYG